jgi:hypothetical protein
MPLTKHSVLLLNRALFCLLAVIIALSGKAKELPEEAYGGSIDIVFVIDISGSTGGILYSVRGKFWEIQNEIARLDPQPEYRLGIVCMGRPSFKNENNYVQVISDLTQDIDAAAYPFFQIKDVTAPGNYFMGHALDVAVNDISWTEDPNAIKLLYLVGNGKPSAGPGFKKPLQTAKEKGIIINSLYFLSYSNQKEQAEWKTIANESGGEFFIIGLKEPAIVLEKPYDGALLREANHMINTSYIYYGPNGLERHEMQAELDEEAELQGENQVEARTFFKSSQLYQDKNYSWDLIDLVNTGKGSAQSEKRKFMDERLQEMTNAEFAQYVTEIAFERKEYISIIKMLSTQREEFLKEKREKMKNYRFGKTFFGVVNKTIAETAKKYGYTVSY